jgi:hypothetical protein
MLSHAEVLKERLPEATGEEKSSKYPSAIQDLAAVTNVLAGILLRASIVTVMWCVQAG